MHIEDQFVVDLQQHSGLEIAVQDFAMDVTHREFNHVRGRALDARVNGVSLFPLTGGRVARVDVAQIAAAAGDRFDESVLAGELDGFVHVGPDAGKLIEVIGYQVRRLLSGNVQAVGEAERRDAVDNAEIDGLRVSPHIFGRPVDAVDFLSGRGVDVAALSENLR